MSTSISNLKDPLEELLPELFSHSLSFLPPSSIARTAALSKRWRSTVHSIQSLHREIDLTNFQWVFQSEVVKILYHFTRLSLLSSHTLVKVSLNLTSFYQEYFTNHMNGDLQFDILFMTLRQSQVSLREISLKFVGGARNISLQGHDEIIQFFLKIIRELQSFEALRTIKIDSTLPLSLEAGHQKRFSLDNSEKRCKLGKSNEICKVMREVKKLVDTGITELYLHGDVLEEQVENEITIGEELRKSNLTIQHLEIEYLVPRDDLDLWKHVVGCLNLLSLRLRLSAEGEGGELKLLKVPDGVKLSKLKDLYLAIHEYQVEWISVTRWIGSNLESLYLELDVVSCQGRKGLFSRQINGSVIFNSKETLKVLHLDFWYLSDVEEFDPVEGEDVICFPNLEQAFFDHLNHQVFFFLSRIVSPKLVDLRIDSPFLEISGLEYIIKLLESHASKLVELHLDVGCNLQFQEIPLILQDLKLRFDCLESAVVGYALKNHRLVETLAESYYPNLYSLSIVEETDGDWEYSSPSLRRLFKSNAPKLEIWEMMGNDS